MSSYRPMCVKWSARRLDSKRHCGTLPLGQSLQGGAAAIHTIAIFCRIVDFFGDAGFCWRLAVALRRRGVGHVILVIDRLNILDELRGAERIPGVTVLPWNVAQDQWQQHGVPEEHRADLVIEAFACNPPKTYLEALSPQAQWITLDYLATEPWADSAHGQSSPSPSLRDSVAAHRRWWVPGFSAATGGLLHGSWRHITARERRAWRRELTGESIDNDVFLVLAFGYADARWESLKSLLDTQLPKGFKSYRLWQPKGIEFSQREFDEILQACDLNFVRGEDSFVRAHWAAAGPWQVPFVWQPYRQEGKAHGHKLAGWMQQVLVAPALAPLQDFHWAWNGIRPAESHADLSLSGAWVDLAGHYGEVRSQLNKACLRLASRKSLEDGLLRALWPPQ
ncbi:MAG: elongation factor P maturation arginine rhamnosyltransferase EarP [Burkholderiaceae bacterium]|nr:elongation factor P maturation arginine rhamnosyltransferase EarP [Burkholderiaceae bacterium]